MLLESNAFFSQLTIEVAGSHDFVPIKMNVSPAFFRELQNRIYAHNLTAYVAIAIV
jgi:hypothetical protein